ncbi:MAG TPA: histidine kinase, partial [Gammaproteobacteria bacterium]|nr:histidine kinase [Gammaproteobacteria bacterium]
DVINALKDSGQHHCLVLERETHKIRGIFSSNELSRRLHVPIDIAKPSTFFSLFKALSH